MDTQLIDSVVTNNPSRSKHLTKCVDTLRRMADRCGFTQTIALNNLNMEWIYPVTGYVAKIPKTTKFKAEPFLARMFCGISIMTVPASSNLENPELFRRASWILRGSIHDRSPRPFDPNDRDKPWIPSLGDRSSYIGVYSGKMSDTHQNSIICNAGLDYSVECALQRFFMQEELAGKTYGEVFKSSFIDGVISYSLENRRRLIHTFMHVIDLTDKPMHKGIPIKINQPIEQDYQSQEFKDFLKLLLRGLLTYCRPDRVNKLSPYFVFPSDDNIPESLHDYPLGNIFNCIRNHDKYTEDNTSAYTEANQTLTHLLSVRMGATIEIITSDTVNKYGTSIHVDADIMYNHVSTIGSHCIFFSESSSTLGSKGKSFTSSKFIYGPTIYMHGSNDISKTTAWRSNILDAFPITTPDTGIKKSDETDNSNYRTKFISTESLLSNNILFNCNRDNINNKLPVNLGFKPSGENTVICATPIIVRLSK